MVIPVTSKELANCNSKQGQDWDHWYVKKGRGVRNEIEHGSGTKVTKETTKKGMRCGG
jgi:hypothetical protein